MCAYSPASFPHTSTSTDVSAALSRATHLLAQGRFADAETLSRTAAAQALTPADRSRAAVTLAQALFELGQSKKARDVADSAVEGAPVTHAPSYALFFVAASLALEAAEPQDAERYLMKWINISATAGGPALPVHAASRKHASGLIRLLVLQAMDSKSPSYEERARGVVEQMRKIVGDSEASALISEVSSRQVRAIVPRQTEKGIKQQIMEALHFVRSFITRADGLRSFVNRFGGARNVFSTLAVLYIILTIVGSMRKRLRLARREVRAYLKDSASNAARSLGTRSVRP